MRIAKVSVALVALLACAWFALGAREAHQLDRAMAIVAQSPAPSTRQLADANSLLRSAAELNPDSEVTLLRARVALLEHQHARAEQIAEEVTREEPKNLLAWDALAQIAGGDQRTLFRALGEINRLDPPPPQSG
jgi:predicted Zn-dependent protease